MATRTTTQASNRLGEHPNNNVKLPGGVHENIYISVPSLNFRLSLKRSLNSKIAPLLGQMRLFPSLDSIDPFGLYNIKRDEIASLDFKFPVSVKLDGNVPLTLYRAPKA